MARVFVKVAQRNVVALIVLKVLNVCVVEVKCRQVIQTVAVIENMAPFLNDSDLGAAIDKPGKGPPCLFDIQQDLPKRNAPQPLYIIPNTNKFWLPNAQGKLQVARGAAIELYCSKSFANAAESSNEAPSSNSGTKQFCNVLNVDKSAKIVRPRCLHGKMLIWQGKEYELQQFICSQPPRYAVEQLHEKCPRAVDGQASVNAQMYRVGFNVTRRRFLETMRICYDNAVWHTLYVQHSLLPASIHFQKSIGRMSFSKAGLFKDVNINHLYTQQQQQRQAAALLQGQHQHLFDNRTLFLARGHLAAKADFIYGNQQRSTFNWLNVAPQWQSFNGGQWAALEDEVRAFVARSKLLVDCYTGTFGVLQFPYKVCDVASNGNKSCAGDIIKYRDFYLTADSNNNGLLPVPQLYYRVLVDRAHQPWRGIALIGVNNPHATINEIHASYIICEDIHNQLAWLQWIRNTNLRKGFLYACRVPDFVAAVGNLPKSLLNVEELLA